MEVLTVLSSVLCETSDSVKSRLLLMSYCMCKDVCAVCAFLLMIVFKPINSLSNPKAVSVQLVWI